MFSMWVENFLKGSFYNPLYEGLTKIVKLESSLTKSSIL